MKNIRKSISVILALVAAFALVGCAKENRLRPYVSELIENVYAGTSEHYTVRGKAGFYETERARDGQAGATAPFLVLTLPQTPDAETVTATIEIDGQPHTEKFTYDPVRFTCRAVFETAFDEETFEIVLRKNGEEERVMMTSVLPENTLDLNGVLDVLLQSQPDLVESYMKNGVFEGELTAKVNVRDEKAYWYVAITDTAGRTHAFLMDGASGEILAAKDLFQ